MVFLSPLFTVFSTTKSATPVPVAVIIALLLSVAVATVKILEFAVEQDQERGALVMAWRIIALMVVLSPTNILISSTLGSRVKLLIAGSTTTRQVAVIVFPEELVREAVTVTSPVVFLIAFIKPLSSTVTLDGSELIHITGSSYVPL